MTQAQALQALRVLVVALSGVSDALVLLAYAEMGRPSAAHLLLRIITDTATGYGQLAGTTVTQRRQLRVQIDAFGASAVAALPRVAALLQSIDARIIAATVAVHAVGDVRDTTSIMHAAWEPRATLDVTVGYEAVHTSTSPSLPVSKITVDLADAGVVIVVDIP